MFCSQCGTKILIEGRFCQNCGHQIIDTEVLQHIPTVTESSEKIPYDDPNPDERNSIHQQGISEPIINQAQIESTNVDEKKKDTISPFDEMLVGLGVCVVSFYLAFSKDSWYWAIFGALFLLGAIYNLWRGFGGSVNIQLPDKKTQKY